ncbi:MAG: hypothetical protein FJ290_21655 [Planctomycetes bacterium]|nr:hypothetical protein [Planctomycetota bacterium]
MVGTGKPGNQQERLERCVGLGYVRIAPGRMLHNLIGGGNEYDRGSTNAPADTILLLREKDLEGDFEFGDPLNLDFRLQPDSRFRATAPGGRDRGPYPYQPNVFYVSLAGDDRASGLSMRQAWRTLERALKDLRPGDTLYLTEGEYAAVPWNKAGNREKPIRVCARGRGTVLVTGGLSLAGGAGIVFERLDFSHGVTLSESHDLAFKNCTFFGPADGLSAARVENLEVAHSVFVRVPLRLSRCKAATLSGNLYANAGKPAVRLDTVGAIRYSDYNNYQDAAPSWEVSDATWSFADLQQRHDRYSQALTPEFAIEKGVPRLANGISFKSLGPHSTALGIHHEHDVAAKALRLVGPFLHSTSDTTADIEWWTSHPATFSLSWGETPEMKNTVDGFTGSGRFNTYSLTALKPGQTYYFKIASADAMLAGLKPTNAPLSFRTAATAAEPRVYYVAPDGNDASESPEMLVRNCVLHGGWTSLALSRCPGSVVENDVFIMTILRQLTADATAIARRNVFCECIRNKAHQTLLELSQDVTETDNCFYLRWPEEEKLAVNDMPLPKYRVRTGSNAFAANPMMPGTPGWRQGWQQSSDKDFDEFFATNPELIVRDIGLQPEAFKDFKLGVANLPYDRA